MFEGTPSQKPKYFDVLKKLGYSLEDPYSKYNKQWSNEYIWKKRIGNFKIIVKESFKYPGLFRVYLNQASDVTSDGEKITKGNTYHDVEENGNYFETPEELKNFLKNAENKVKNHVMFRNISEEEYDEERKNAIEVVYSYYSGASGNYTGD